METETVELLPHLLMIRFEAGQAFLWRDPDGLTLVDAGPVGSGAGVVRAIAALGASPAELRRIVLTHFHEDHAGGAAELVAAGGVEVFAHRLEAPVIQGDVPGPAPDLSDAPAWERELYAHRPSLPPAPPVRVDHHVEDGDVLPFGGGARVVAAPGHTPGSAAFHLPAAGVLFLGDAAANVGGRTMPGVFNTDRPRAEQTFRELALLDTEIACFGHGETIVGSAGDALRAAAAGLS